MVVETGEAAAAALAARSWAMTATAWVDRADAGDVMWRQALRLDSPAARPPSEYRAGAWRALTARRGE